MTWTLTFSASASHLILTAPLFRKLDGVAEQIEQDLLYPAGVAGDGFDSGSDFESKFKSFTISERARALPTFSMI